MRNNRTLFLLAFLLASLPAFAGINFSQNQAKIVIAPTCNHIPISIPYLLDDGAFDESSITVESDSNWAIPSVNTESDQIDIAFATENVIASYTATITVNDGESITELFIQSRVPPLDIYRLIDDPLRSKVYGIQRDGVDNGSIIAFDPVQESFISCITVGDSPTDFVINDDSTELLVINSVGKSIDVIDLQTFSLTETINLPKYTTWGDAGDTTANIDLGPDDIIYYTDGAWGPVLHALKRSTGEVQQSILFDGSSPSNDTGFMDFAVTGDKTKLVAMPQYGWSAGAHYNVIGQYSISGDGTVSFVKETNLSNFSREPFEAPVLLSGDDQIAIMKTIATDPANTDNLDREFASAIWSMNPSGSVVATADKLYEYETGIELFTIPDSSVGSYDYLYTKAQAFTSDFSRFVYYSSSNRTLTVVNLIDEIGLQILGQSLSPQDGAVVNAPEELIWAPLDGVDQYDLYLCPDEDAINAANSTSSCFIERVTGTSFVLSETFEIGTEYFWRIDPITALGPETGSVYSFTVSDISFDKTKINANTVNGHADYQVDVQLVSEEPGASWTASAADSWVTFTENTGLTPATLNVHLDSTSLSAGLHSSTITLESELGELQIPVRLQVEPLKLTHIRSDRNSAITYAISEDEDSVISQAYLLEIDSTTETILRVMPVGSSVTDFAIHYADNLIYVANWKSGNLRSIDKNTFEHIKSIAFQPAGATGYSEGDVYRVAAGVSQRLVIEEQDQWVDISIFDTKAEVEVTQAFVREGGGAFDPTGRYYYHGENNSSGASILKYDTSGDTFTSLAEIRPTEISSYYGSREVIISEDGSRIFWAGVVLDADLETEWGIGEIVYSTSDDGRYAFSESAIYDVNLRRQVLTMPSITQVSGYNSTSKKLIVQVDNSIKFYPLSSPISILAPVLQISNQTANSIDLSWTDKSLEMEFIVQQKEVGSNAWIDISTVSANVTNVTATNLQNGSTYEFRVRATTSGNSSSWSNIVSNDLDNDGVPDISDVYPLISIGDLLDTDSDGAPNNCDNACKAAGMSADNDNDNDGVPNNLDDTPLGLDQKIQSLYSGRMHVLPDINGDGIAELGVLSVDIWLSQVKLEILNGKDRANIDQVVWADNFSDASLTLHVIPDMNDNGFDDIGLFGIQNTANNAGKPQMFVRDLNTGNRVNVYNWPANWTEVSALVLDDMSGDGLSEIAIQGRFKEGSRPQLIVKESNTNNVMATYSYPDLFVSPQYFQHSDSNGDGYREISTFGRLNSNNKIQVKITNGFNPSNKMKAYNFPDNWSDVSWVRLDDSNNDGIDDWGLFGINKDDGRPQLINKDGTNPRGALRIYAWSADIQNATFYRVPDMNNDGVDEVAAAGRRSNNGRYQFQVQDGVDRNQILANHNLNLNLESVSYHVLPDFSGDERAEIGFLGTNPLGEYELVIRHGDTADGEYARHNLGSNWQNTPSIISLGDTDGDGQSNLLVHGQNANGEQLVMMSL